MLQTKVNSVENIRPNKGFSYQSDKKVRFDFSFLLTGFTVMSPNKGTLNFRRISTINRIFRYFDYSLISINFRKSRTEPDEKTQNFEKGLCFILDHYSEKSEIALTHGDRRSSHLGPKSEAY